MKPSLGKILFVWMVAIGQLWGAAYTWSVLETPKTLVVGQSGIIRYQCKFDTNAADYTVEFKPGNGANYKASILTQRDQIQDNKRVHTFDVLIVPTQAGAIHVDLSALIRHTTFASIENASIGRENVKKYDFDDETAYLPKVIVSAKENLETITGELTLDVHADTKAVRAYEPLHLSVTVKGKGNLDELIPFDINISGVKVFTQPLQQSLTPSAHGVEGEVSQEFALVSGESYSIEPLRLSYYDTAKNRIVVLKSKPIYVEVGEGYEISSLLDVPKMSDYGTLKRLGYALFFVGLGIGLNEVIRWLWKHRPKREKRYFWDNASTQNELVQLLSLSGEKHFDEVIKAVEEGKMDLAEAKKTLRSQEEKQ